MKNFGFGLLIFLACITSRGDAKKISSTDFEVDTYGLCQAPSKRTEEQEKLFKMCRNAYDEMIKEHYNCKANSSTKDEFAICIKNADRKLKDFLIIIK